MANRIQIRRGTSSELVGKQVYQGELLWVTDEKKLYIGTTNGTVAGTFPKYENSSHESVVKVISPDASEVKYDNTTSGLSATTVQGAIDELSAEKQEKLGGSVNEDGKVVIASSTLGTVTYREIDTAITSQTSTSSNHLVTVGAVKDELDTLGTTKQDKVNNAVENNIATWDGAGNTKDSGKAIVTSVAGVGTDTNIPTEKAVRSAITDALTSAVNYRGMCIESELPTTDLHKGDFWSISDFDVTYPSSQTGHVSNGRAIYNGSSWDKEVDEYLSPDGTSINLNGTGELQIKPITQSDTTSTETASFGGTVAVVNSVTRNTRGQVTGIDVKTVTMPSLGKTSTTAAQGDLAEYIANRVTTIGPATGTGAASDEKYPTEKAVRTQLDTKADKSNITASGTGANDYSLVQYNTQGIVIAGTKIIDGGAF